MEIINLTLKQLNEKISSGDLSRKEIVSAYLKRIEETEDDLNSFVSVFAEEALKTAEDLDKKPKSGTLGGIPVGIKDVLCTKGQRTTASSKMLEEFKPPYDATSVKHLKKAGAVVIGKNNCDAWAHGASTENSDFGVTHNPWDKSRVPGGSSGGSAAAVAASQVPFSIGSDTGGSIRQPAGFCGAVGLKPTYGRVSRYGLIAMASSLDVVGPITRDVYDSALVMEILSGRDKFDSTTAEVEVPKYTQLLGKSIKGKKIGLPREYFGLGLDKETEAVFKKSLKIFEKLGAEIVDINLPHTEYGIAVYYIIQPAEVSSNLGRFDGIKYGFSAKDSSDLIDHYFKTRDEGFGAEAKRRIMLGTYVLSSGYYDAYYLKAQKVRTLIRNDFNNVFNAKNSSKVDFIVSPVSPTPAFKIGEKTSDPLSMYLADVYTVQANLAGIPSISIPAGFSSQKLPIGIQIMGSHWEEAQILNMAYLFEQETKNELWRKYKTEV